MCGTSSSNAFSRLARDERGATAVEYALALFAVLLVAALSVKFLGKAVDCGATTAAGTIQGGGSGGECGGATASAGKGAGAGGNGAGTNAGGNGSGASNGGGGGSSGGSGTGGGDSNGGDIGVGGPIGGLIGGSGSSAGGSSGGGSKGSGSSGSGASNGGSGGSAGGGGGGSGSTGGDDRIFADGFDPKPGSTTSDPPKPAPSGDTGDGTGLLAASGSPSGTPSVVPTGNVVGTPAGSTFQGGGGVTRGAGATGDFGTKPGTSSYAVIGTEPKPIDSTFAALSSDVYGDSHHTIDGFRPLNDDELRENGITTPLRDDSTGFHAAIYTNGKLYVVAYAGTDDVDVFHGDAHADVKQGLGEDTIQYRQALALAKEAKLAYGDNLACTGHSLGGGLAATCALGTASPAVTYNAAGLHDYTLLGLGLDPSATRDLADRSGIVRSYRVDGEALTSTQRAVSLGGFGFSSQSIGHDVPLADPNPINPLISSNPAFTGFGLAHSAELHKIGSVQQAFHQQYPQFKQPKIDPAGATGSW